jgi:hypothetical protein
MKVSTPPGVKVSMTLSDGVLRLAGRTRAGVNVRATGTLLVRVSDAVPKLALMFDESGLATAEHTLGIVSPFAVGGRPTSVPIKLTHRFSSC